MKFMVYRTAVNTQDDLLNRIMLAAERIRNDQDELARVSRSLLRLWETQINILNILRYWCKGKEGG
jgi:hypothetical protein